MFRQLHLQVMNVKSNTVHLFQYILNGWVCNLVRNWTRRHFFCRIFVTRWRNMWLCSLPSWPLKTISRFCKRKISSINMEFAMMLGGHPSCVELICCRIIVAWSETYLAGRGTVTSVSGVPGWECPDRARVLGIPGWGCGERNGDKNCALRNTLWAGQRLVDLLNTLRTGNFLWMQTFPAV